MTCYRPTRLLKLNGTSSFRLVQGSECPSTIRYAALSYCWGSKPVDSLLRLLQSTLGDLSQNHPVGGLPKTFRDAIHVAQRLGVHYLWIDRLCIFQDSAKDWHKEAFTMQDVHRNAYIGIAALSAKDDEGGCFFERDPDKVAPALIQLKTTRSGENKTFRPELEKYWSWKLAYQGEPLCQRSWVVQERLLATRTLYFGSKQVFWECHRKKSCEVHPEGIYNVMRLERSEDDHLRGPQSSHLWKDLLDTEPRAGLSEPYEQLFFDWQVVVQYYAIRQLTVASDKLVALSGLANDMKASLERMKPGPHQYLAGLWGEKLLSSLSWKMDRPAKRALIYRAPSWSWACLDAGDLSIPRYGDDAVYLATLVSANMSYRGQEETGEITSGILILDGSCVWAKVQLNAIDSFGDEVESMWTLDGPVHLPTTFKVWFDTLDDRMEDVFLLWTWKSRMMYYGLALAPVGQDKYRRLGALSSHRQTDDNTRALIQALPKPRRIGII